MGRLFGTDGVRGIANRTLTCDMALHLGAAAARLLAKPEKRPVIAVGADTRVSSDMLSLSVASGLCSAGADVLMLGIIPTPGVAYLTMEYGCDAGVMISASHNPPEFNGIKLISSAGMKLPDELEERIELLMESPPAAAPSMDVGRVRFIHEDAISDYIRHLQHTAPCPLTGLKLAIDCANGAAAITAEALFTALGAQVRMLGCDTKSGLINSGCGSTDTAMLARYVTADALDAGIAFDGDADRCMMVDETGAPVDGDMMLAICAANMPEVCAGRVVGTVMSNLGFIRFCRGHGIEFSATRVGDRYVLEKMLQDGCMLGGEQSGHLIFLEHATTGDGQLTAIQVLSAMRRTGQKLSRLASVMTRYPQHMINIPVSDAGKAALYTDPRAEAAIAEARVELGDEGRILVRTSGTEPVVRVMAEGADEALVVGIIRRTADKLSDLLK